MTTTRQDERIDARLSKAHKALLKRAADLAGQPISQFLVTSALERAQQLIDEHMQTQLSADDARRFLALIDAGKPNATLVRAAKLHRRRHA